MSAWPNTLPQVPLADGYSDTPLDNVLRTTNEIGPDQRRLRGTVAGHKINCKFYITNALIGDFETFYTTTLHLGVDSFTMPIPILGSVSAHFNSVPKKSAFGADWFVTMELITDP
jgi:hypothetical protein